MADNPFKAILNVRRDEVPLVLAMFTYFFAVIMTFWILKPIKKAAFIGYYEAADGFHHFGWALDGSQVELLAKVGNMFIAFAAVVVFTWLARRMRRQQLTLVFCGFCAVALAYFAFATADSSNSTEAQGWLLYLFGDLYNTLMVATFFAFLNDSFSPEAAKRNYGPIILGGVTGGAVGSMFVQFQIDAFSFRTWMFICIGITGIIALVAIIAGRLVDRAPPPEKQTSDEPEPPQSNVALEGARIVFRSRYLLAIVTIVAIYEIVSTVMDFQFTATIAERVAREDLDNAFSTTYAITNALALFIQLFLTTVILSKFRHSVALLLMPVVVLFASSGYLLAPIVYTAASLTISDNALNYSINQSAREALYTPTSRDEKYKAKAFIDMFVQRFAKAVAVGVSLGITMFLGEGEGVDFSSLRYLSIFVILLVVLWIAAARYAGRRFEQLTADAPR